MRFVVKTSTAPRRGPTFRKAGLFVQVLVVFLKSPRINLPVRSSAPFTSRLSLVWSIKLARFGKMPVIFTDGISKPRTDPFALVEYFDLATAV